MEIVIVSTIAIFCVWSLLTCKEPKPYCSYCYKNDCVGTEQPVCHEQTKDDAVDAWISTSGLMTSPNIETIVVYDFEYPKETETCNRDKYSILIYVYKDEKYIDEKYLIEIISSKKSVNHWKRINEDIRYSEYFPTKEEIIKFIDLIQNQFEKDFTEKEFLDLKNQIEKYEFETNKFEQIEQILLMK